MDINWPRTATWAAIVGGAAYLLVGKKSVATGAMVGAVASLVLPEAMPAPLPNSGSVLTLRSPSAQGGFPNTWWVSPNAPPYNVPKL